MTAKIPDAVRFAIIAEYDGECQYCQAPDATHIDHIVPRSKGGSDDIGNLILACRSCNFRKNNGLISERYVALITAIAEKRRNSVQRRIDEYSGGLSAGQALARCAEAQAGEYQAAKRALRRAFEQLLFRAYFLADIHPGHPLAAEAKAFFIEHRHICPKMAVMREPGSMTLDQKLDELAEDGERVLAELNEIAYGKAEN